ncbi:MAG: hypothetical protein ACFFG0_11540 [Candidatus Thorarchaeota archaeon]
MESDITLRDETRLHIKMAEEIFLIKLKEFNQHYKIFNEQLLILKPLAIELHDAYAELCRERAGTEIRANPGSGEVISPCKACELDSVCGKVGFIRDEVRIPNDD